MNNRKFDLQETVGDGVDSIDLAQNRDVKCSYVHVNEIWVTSKGRNFPTNRWTISCLRRIILCELVNCLAIFSTLFLQLHNSIGWRICYSNCCGLNEVSE